MMESSSSSTTLTAFLLTMEPDKLIVPNTSIAEVISVATMIPVAKKPNWFLGKLGWQGRTVPMISFGRINEDIDQLSQFRQAAIIRGGNFPDELPVFAIALTETPKMMQLTEADLIVVDGEAGTAADAIVEVAGQQAFIPNIKYMEEKIIEHLV